MDNVPVRVNGPTPEGRNTAPQSAHAPRGGKQKSKKTINTSLAVVGVVLLLLLALCGWFLYRSSLVAHIDTSKYQAVFFTNGQVYFGKLQQLNGGYYKLNDIFYLQAQSNEEDANDSENPQATSDQQSPDVQLVKLGSEIHGPDDEMIINKDQVLFFENLKEDGRVSQSVDSYKGDNN